MSSSRERPKARQQNLEREWFCQVVVCAGIQPGADVVRSIARGEQQDRCVNSRLPQLPDDRNTIQFRQHDVEHDQIELARLRGLQPFPPIESKNAGVAGFIHSLLELARELSIILNNKNSHLYQYQYGRRF